MLKHSGDVGIADKAQLLARRTILGRIVRFYTNGEHIVEHEGLTDDEQFESEILRFAHASLLINAGVGDKKIMYVNAVVNPCAVWIYGRRAETFINEAKAKLSGEVIVDSNPVQLMRN